MCRSIKPLYHVDPPATNDEIYAASLQFVRKISGMRQPSKANAAAFDRAVAEIEISIATLLADLESSSPPRNRALEAERARARSAARFARPAN